MPATTTTRRGFTLIETLIVVTILGTIAAIVTPQFTQAHEDTIRANVTTQLQRVRKQIMLYRNTYSSAQYDEFQDVDTFWDDLVALNFLESAPVNPLTGSSAVGTEPSVDIGWVWGPDPNGIRPSYSVYAVDVDGTYYGD